MKCLGTDTLLEQFLTFHNSLTFFKNRVKAVSMIPRKIHIILKISTGLQILLKPFINFLGAHAAQIQKPWSWRKITVYLQCGYTDDVSWKYVQNFDKVFFFFFFFGLSQREAHSFYDSYCFQIFFWCGPFLKSLLNLLQYCFCFMFWFFGHKAQGTLPPQPGIKSAFLALEGGLNPWTTREVPQIHPLEVSFCDKDLHLQGFGWGQESKQAQSWSEKMSTR